MKKRAYKALLTTQPTVILAFLNLLDKALKNN